MKNKITTGLENDYTIKPETRTIYAVYHNGELFDECDDEAEARDTIKHLKRIDRLREKALATPGLTRFKIGDRIRYQKGASRYGGEDIPAIIVDIFYDPGDLRADPWLRYKLKWKNGVLNDYPIKAVEEVAELDK